MADSQMNLREIISRNEHIIDVLNDMATETNKLSQKADVYTQELQDRIMASVSKLLEEIKDILAETKKKTESFSKAKRDGAEYLSNTEALLSKKIDRI